MESSIKLAQQTEKAMIEQTRIVNEAGNLFLKINASTKNLIKDINNISTLVYDMDKNKDTVLTSIENISQASEENASSVNEVSTSTNKQLSSIYELVEMSNQLSGLAEKLTNSMARFKA